MLFLAYDVGTSSVKSTLVNELGDIVSFANFDYPHDAECLHTEQNPYSWWEGVCITTKKLFERNPEYAVKVEAIGTGGHMLGCLPVDANGEPLRPAMLHSDSRSTYEEVIIADSIGRDEIYSRTGNILNAQSSLAKILWIKANEPDVYEKTAKFLQSKDYITSKLTGNIDTGDYSDGAHAHLMDINTKQPLVDVFIELVIDPGKITVFRRGTEIAGKLNREAAALLGLKAGIPVITGGGDGACANAGAGIAAGEMYCSLGTTAWLSYNSPTPVFDGAARLFNLPALDGGGVGVYGTTQTAGKCIEWASSLFGVSDVNEFNRIAAKAPEGSDGLVFLPYLEGERSPIFDTKARGVYFYIGTEHSRAHFLRATLEGVTLALRSILDVYRETRIIKDIRIIGGGGSSQLWRQMMADIFNVRTWSVTTIPSGVTSRGVALAAAVGAGVYESLSQAGTALSPAEESKPRTEFIELYNDRFQMFTGLYHRVKDLY